MQIYQRCFTDFSAEPTLRFDSNFQISNDETVEKFYPFENIFKVNIGKKIEENDLPETIEYVEIGNADSNGNITSNLIDFENPNSDTTRLIKKIKAGKIQQLETGDIIIAKTRPNLKKIVYISEERSELYFTTDFLTLRPKDNSIIYYYLLRTVLFNTLLSSSRRGKGYPTINYNDLKILKVPIDLVSRIDNISSNLKSQIIDKHLEIENYTSISKSVTDIVDKVFQEVFDFDYDKFNELVQQKINKVTFSSLANSAELRFNTTYHKKSAQFVIEELKRVSNRKIKDFLLVPIVLGSSISPSNYDSSTDKYYISMESIKYYNVNLLGKNKISEEYFNLNKEKRIEKNDIIMARSGVSIGKCALVKEEADGIFADFTMRIRLENYNQKFAYYYFRSSYFQHLIHTHKKGLQNKNIYPNIIQEFPLLDIDIAIQNSLVRNIDQQINTQKNGTNIINQNREEIESTLIDYCYSDSYSNVLI